MRAISSAIAALLFLAIAHAAPDEDKLGKARGYPIGNARTWFFDESVRVGSFTAQGEIDGISGGSVNTLRPSPNPMPLPRAAEEPGYRWAVGNEKDLSVDDYLSRQRIMGLLIIKDSVIQVERYQYERTPQNRFVSNSMAKSITSLAVGMALHEGKIKSLDDRADRYAPKLSGTLFGETTVRNLLLMASGARYTEEYTGNDDSAKFARAMTSNGIVKAAEIVTERDTAQGTRFSYASANTHVLAAVMHGATGTSVSDYMVPRLWQAIGAETSALWRTDKTGLEMAAANFNATLKDYGRLGVVLANDGMRPDTGQRVVPRDYLLAATDWKRLPEAFHPRKATPYFGYGYQFWLYPGEKRRFALLGVYGQMILVDPALKLVVVQTAANATALSGKTSLGQEADAFWRGVVRHYGSW